MVELIAIFIFVTAIFGASAILYRKLPLILALPEFSAVQFNWRDSLLKIKERLALQNFSFEALLQKILSKIRILTLKIDSLTSVRLQKLRKKSQEKKSEEEVDNYWQEVKKFKKRKKSSLSKPK